MFITNVIYFDTRVDNVAIKKIDFKKNNFEARFMICISKREIYDDDDFNFDSWRWYDKIFLENQLCLIEIIEMIMRSEFENKKCQNETRYCMSYNVFAWVFLSTFDWKLWREKTMNWHCSFENDFVLLNAS